MPPTTLRGDSTYRSDLDLSSITQHPTLTVSYKLKIRAAITTFFTRQVDLHSYYWLNKKKHRAFLLRRFLHSSTALRLAHTGNTEVHGFFQRLLGRAISQASEISEMLDLLAFQPETLLARMSGSGVTCFALVETLQAARAIASHLQEARENGWIRAARI
ncbi:hypothetical protein ACQU0X_08310 [Pseudovibrio ascidiaceicola]|uniref:hypothetical protein n=1 Tax=Pseudovibrio ascidiaceicola TaxID=285279 RepID=UPI003D36CDCA